MAKSKMGTDSDALAHAARTKMMNDLIVRTMEPAAREVEERASQKPSEKPPYEPTEWMVVHDTVLVSIAAGGTFVLRAGTHFSDAMTKRLLDAVNAKYITVS